LCRAVNEQIRSRTTSTDFEDELDLLCECDRHGCLEMFRISLNDYERVRATPDCFLVRPEHVTEESERIVALRTCFVVVEQVAADSIAHVAQ
jgi:hypothetical protein